LAAQIGSATLSVTPEDFGCVSGDEKEALNNSAKLQKMVEYAERNGMKIISGANKRYYISQSIQIRMPLTIDFNRAILVATDTIDMIVISRGNKNNKLYAGKISGLYLDMNKKAKSGLYCRNVVKLRVNDCWVFNVSASGCGVAVKKGGEMFFDNIHIEGGENNACGIRIETHDCHFSDCVMINCHVAVDNNGSNFFERVHAWMENGRWIPGGTFFKIRSSGPIFLHQCFSDTFDRAFDIESKTKLFITQFKNFHNRNMWKWREVNNIKPEIFHFKTQNIADNSYITLDNSYIGSLVFEGKNYQKFSNLNDQQVKMYHTLTELE